MEEDDTFSKQFIIGSDVIIGGPHGDYTAQQKLDKLVEAIKLTHPSFNMNELEEGLYDTESAIKYYNKKKQLLKTEWGVKYGRELDEIDKTIEELSK